MTMRMILERFCLYRSCRRLPGIVCMTVNDENRNAQFVVLWRQPAPKARVRSTLEMIGNEPDSETLGIAPDGSTCPDIGKFKEFDGEAVAYQAPYFYVAGSHGCGRNNGKFRLSSFMLARIKVPETGPILDQHGSLVTTGDGELVQTTYRLSEVLRSAPTVGPFFAKDLKTQDGEHRGHRGLRRQARRRITRAIHRWQSLSSGSEF